MIRTTSITNLVLGASVLCSGLSAQEQAGGFGFPKQTTIEAVRQSPQAFKNVWVTFTAQFHSIGELHNPFFTRFTRSDYVNFAAWSTEQKIWERKEFDNPCATLFCDKKQDELLSTVYGLRRYTRIKLTGIIRNAFQGQPWIEITAIEPLEGRLTTASLMHMSRAFQMMDAHKWQAASVELNLASSEQLTEHARGWVHAYQGLCLLRLGRPSGASKQLKVAHGLLPDESRVTGWLETCAKDPRSGVDQQITTAQVRRGDRPMWEAVDTANSRSKSKTPADEKGSRPMVGDKAVPGAKADAKPAPQK